MSNKMKQLRESVVKSSYSSKEGHIPSALSILDILWVLYDKILKLGKTPLNPDRDYFILSKGHASLGLYAVLAEKELIPKKSLIDFCSFDSMLGGHPDRNKVPWVEASTGSLGHGFPIAVGIAMGIKIQDKKNRVFTVIGDGECNEGTIWESALLAAHHKLNNLYCVVDYNHSTDRALGVGNLTEKFKSFGWNSLEADGHNQDEIERMLKKVPEKADTPTIVIAKTIKGYGIKSMENNPAWHHRSPTTEELANILKEIQHHD